MWRRRDPAEAQVAAECESFLTGTYAETVGELGGTVPAWGWVNLLAHGSAAQLREATSVASHPAFGGVAGEWWSPPGT